MGRSEHSIPNLPIKRFNPFRFFSLKKSRFIKQCVSSFLIVSLLVPTLIPPAQVFATISYTYDANGNMTSDGTNCYTYNDANQLAQATNCSSGKTVASYVYDYQGNRIEKKSYDANDSLTKTTYTPTQSYETVKLASNSATQNTTYYFVNDKLVARKNPDTSKSYVLQDNLNSTSVLTNQTGNVLEKTSYYPFGAIRTGGALSKQLFTGQINDPETGLDYYNSRYYNPHIARFAQPDSVIPNLYDPQALNRYSYVNNNPLSHTDPSGHFALPLLIAAGAAIVAGAETITQIQSYAIIHRESFLQAAADKNFHLDVGRVANAGMLGAVGVVVGIEGALSFLPAVGAGIISVGLRAGNSSLVSSGTNLYFNTGSTVAQMFKGKSSDIKTIQLNSSIYPETAAHVEAAQSEGYSSTLTIDRSNAAIRRAEALKGLPTLQGLDRDEYPSAMFKEGGEGSSVQYIDPSDNRGAGACIMQQCKGLPDGTQVNIQVTH